ncbi:transposase [Streptomyces sp. 5.8]|uniref:transposase n=1 Tax=Streptomyces sp. 5.8 TaxID=3406571 RepID=UPI003BB7FC75
MLGEAKQAAVRQAVLDYRPCEVGLVGQLWTRSLVGGLIAKLHLGRTPIVRRTGNRFSMNAMSAISTTGRMHFMVFTETFDATLMCRFLERLVGHFDHKVHPVVDGHSAHRSKTVRAPGSPPIPTPSSCTSCPRTRRS